MTADPGLFPVEAVRPPPGWVERELDRALRAGFDAGTLVDEDRGLIAGARCAAIALDVALRDPNTKTIYAVAQALTPYREALHALRLPAAIAPAPAKLPAPAPDGAGDSLRDLFGTPE